MDTFVKDITIKTTLKNLFKSYPLFYLLLPLLFTGCNDNDNTYAPLSSRDTAIQKAEDWEDKRYEDILTQKEIPVYSYKVVNEFNHNESSFTEGLAFSDGVLYESIGLWDQSKLLHVDIQTGKIIKKHDLEASYFAEGMTIIGDRVFQLTYQSCTGFIYEKESFKLLETFNFPSQGWGLTSDENQLIMSDGSAVLIFMDPQTMQMIRYVIVKDQVGIVSNLNELEYIDGEIYANIYKSSLIARISPISGEVTGWIDMSGINPDPATLEFPFVLNGIAYDKNTNRLFVTGKCWSKIYEIELVIPIPVKR